MDDTLKAAEECRDCKASATQARGIDLGWRCMTHGVVSLNDYDRAITARKDAEHAALRAAALLAADQLSVADEGYARAIGRTLKAALDATPWEPSEEMVERAAKAMLRHDGDEWSFDGGLSDPNFEPIRKSYRLAARAALKAAFSPGAAQTD